MGPIEWYLDFLNTTDNPLIIIFGGLAGMLLIGVVGYVAGIILWGLIVAVGFVIASPFMLIGGLIYWIGRFISFIPERLSGFFSGSQRPEGPSPQHTQQVTSVRRRQTRSQVRGGLRPLRDAVGRRKCAKTGNLRAVGKPEKPAVNWVTGKRLR